jgi:hypothetical protein
LTRWLALWSWLSGRESDQSDGDGHSLGKERLTDPGS